MFFFLSRLISSTYKVYVYNTYVAVQREFNEFGVFIQIEILLIFSVDEDQTVQRIQFDPDLHNK